MLDLDHVTGESGSISVTMFGCIALVVVLCLFACDLGLFLAARNRAQNAADAAALAAVTESFPLFSSGGTAREAADELARLNGAAVERLVVSGGGERVQVTVSVRPQSLVLARLGIGKRKATASAPNAPGVSAMSVGSNGRPRHSRSDVATVSRASDSDRL